MQNYNLERLQNGVRLLTVPSSETQAATVMVLAATGSDNESKDKNGISHFLEHLCFKGTEDYSVAELRDGFAKVGAKNNAFTGNNYTGYWAKAHADHTDTMLDLLSSMYLRPTVPEAELAKERGVIIEEINMYEDDPPSKVGDLYTDLRYGDQPAGWSILGPKNVIESVTRETILQYHHDHYVGENTLVVVSGNIDEVHIKGQIEKLFTNISSAAMPPRHVTEAQEVASPPVQLYDKAVDQAHLVLGLPGFTQDDPRQYALSLARAVLGGGMASKLFRAIREDRGLAYYVGAANYSYIDRGDFITYAGVTRSRVTEAVDVMQAEIKAMVAGNITDDELVMAQAQVASHYALDFETVDAVARHLAMKEITGEELLTPAEEAKKFTTLTKDDVVTVMNDVIKQPLHLAMVGNGVSNENFHSINYESIYHNHPTVRKW